MLNSPAVVGHHSGDGCVCSHEAVDLGGLLDLISQCVLKNNECHMDMTEGHVHMYVNCSYCSYYVN